MLFERDLRVTKDKSKTDTTKTKHNPEKANNSKIKLPWFSRFSWHLARKRGGLILQSSRANTGPSLGVRSHHNAMSPPSHSRQLTYELEKPESVSNVHDEESCYSSWRRPWTDRMCFSASGSNCSLHSKIRKIPANIRGAFRMFSHSFKRQKNKQIQLKILNNSFHMASAVAAVVFQPVGCIVISLMESKDTNELHWWTRIDVMTWTYTSNKLVKFCWKLVSCWEKKLPVRKISEGQKMNNQYNHCK